ncbi:MAG TPA: IclR family transcriptional regulator [Gaiellaceae bacterium]|nr:IclR family transcriptional regulator [Gaiellaceae bacterium]
MSASKLDTPDTSAAARSTSRGVNATLGILDLLAARGPLQLSELARELPVPKSTIHRICSVLVDRSWAVRDEQGRFQLGIRALAMSVGGSDLPIVTAFRTVAAGLLTRHNETVCLAVLDGDESVYIAIEETSHPVRLVTRVGSRTPAFASASGRVILSGNSQSVIDARFAGRPLVTPTGRRLNGIAELRSILDGVRRSGYAENNGETAIGLYAASVPVQNSAGAIIAALTACIPTSRMTAERHRPLLDDLVAAGRQLSELVSWLPAYDARRPAVPTAASPS